MNTRWFQAPAITMTGISRSCCSFRFLAACALQDQKDGAARRHRTYRLVRRAKGFVTLARETGTPVERLRVEATHPNRVELETGIVVELPPHHASRSPFRLSRPPNWQ